MDIPNKVIDYLNQKKVAYEIIHHLEAFAAQTTAAAEHTTYMRKFAGAILSLVVGLLALWLSLTILGIIELDKVDAELLRSPGLRLTIAPLIALVFCVIGLPLILPWFIAFLSVYCFIPSKSILWKSWAACTFSGLLVGILALWIDGVVYCLLTGGLLSSVNVSLLKSASIPAAILGGATCFSAAIGEKFSKTSSIPSQPTQRNLR